jgi:hypothetical protein
MAAAEAALQLQIRQAVSAALAAHVAAAPVAAPVAHVAVKLPDSWVKDSKMWFSQAEAQFLWKVQSTTTFWSNCQRMSSCQSAGP